MSGALKELTIESELKKMGDVWRETRFSLHKHIKVSGPALQPGSGLLCRTCIYPPCPLDAFALYPCAPTQAHP